MKKHFLKISVAIAVLVPLIYTLCSCEREVFSKTQDGIDTQSAYSEISDTQATIEPITINGMEYIGTETKIDMSDFTSVSYDIAAEYLTKLPFIEQLNTAGLELSAEQYLSLCALKDNVKITSKLTFEGKSIDMSVDEVDLSGHKISDKALFSRILSKIDKKIKFVMCDCGYTNEEMQTLRDSYPTLEFAWRIYMGKWSLRTDDEAFSVMIYNYDYTKMTSEDIQVLKYCTNMYALDLGHQAITDVSIFAELPELRVLILADNKISDIAPLAKCKKLEYLELFVNRISDVSALSECTNLVDLNIGWNRSISDISGIYSLEKIERLWLPTTGAASSKQDEIKQNFPNAKTVFSGPDSISSGWRTHDRYFIMRKMFTNNKYDPDFVSL